MTSLTIAMAGSLPAPSVATAVPRTALHYRGDTLRGGQVQHVEALEVAEEVQPRQLEHAAVDGGHTGRVGLDAGAWGRATVLDRPDRELDGRVDDEALPGA